MSALTGYSITIYFSHGCDRSFFDAYINNVYLFTANLNSFYGYSKYFGEVYDEKVINIRTSFIGPNLKKSGFYEEASKVLVSKQFYTNHYFSGLTTLELSRIISYIINKNKVMNIYGTYNVGGESISRFELATLVREVKGLSIIYGIEYSNPIDRTISAKKFKEHFNYIIPEWKNMLKDQNAYSRRKTEEK